MTGSRVKVIILPRRSVVVDGRGRGEGEVVAVSLREAKALVDEGYATRDLDAAQPKTRPERKSRRAPKRQPLDLAGAEDDHMVLERG